LAETLKSVNLKYLENFERSPSPEDVDRMIHQYLRVKPVSYFDVQKWLKEKIVIARVKGEEYSRWIREICASWKSDREHIPEILHVLIEDAISIEKSFAIKLALGTFPLYHRIRIPRPTRRDPRVVDGDARPLPADTVIVFTMDVHYYLSIKIVLQ
jgi:hypothetical protein